MIWINIIMLRIDNTPFLFRNPTLKYHPEPNELAHRYGVVILSVIDEQTVIITEINNDFLQFTHQNSESLTGINLKDNPLWNDGGQLWNAISLVLKNQETQAIVWQIKTGDSPHIFNCSIIPTFNQDKKLKTLTVILSDNSANIAFADQLQQFNYHDILTGLPNKNYLNEAIEDKISNVCPNGEIAILIINILQFQRINESFGYEAGDKIIQNISYTLERALPDNALLARFEGDKFSILLAESEVGDLQEEAVALANTLHHEMNAALQAEHTEIHLALTIGIAVSRTPLKDGNMLIQRAHIAMKRLGKVSPNKTLVYQPELQTRATSRLKLENELREALKNKELSLNYEPIICLQNGHLVGFEALCRWNHPTRGIISPIEFIPLAEETGLIVPLGNWVLKEACTSLKILKDKYPGVSNITINVNISGLQLLQDDFIATIHEALVHSGLTGNQLKLEITETMLIENAELARDILLDLKSIGISLAIDDFGTGYSSLSYLNQFPIDTLKIDKSFINRMNTTKDSYKIVHIITTLAQTLGMELVAEGIEHESQVVALKKLGCQTGQGFLFSKPLTFEDTEFYVRKETTFLA